MMPKIQTPNDKTIADGFSRGDEGTAMRGPDIDFDYCDEAPEDSTPYATGIDNHLPDSNMPKLLQTHAGEHRADHGDVPLKITKTVYLYVLCAALNSCNLGYDIGVNTGVAPLIQDGLELSDVQIEIFIGALNLFAMFGALGANIISDKFGRRKTFLIAALGFIIGVGLQSIAQSYHVLMFGRVFVGLGVGVGLAIDPLYIAEISPAAYRGELVSYSEIGINVGIVLGFVSGLAFSGVEDETAWRLMIGVGLAPPVLMILLSTFVMPESPRWLIIQGQDTMAQRILTRVYPEEYDVTLVVQDIKDSILREAMAKQAVGWDMILFPTPAVRRMLFVGVGMAIAQQAVGIDAIQYFLVYILDQTGIKDRNQQAGVLIFLGLVKLLCVVLAGKLFDTKGRRPLIMLSLCGMIVALILLSFNFFGATYSSAVGVLGIALYLAFFSLGMGPGAWLIPSEVFPTSIRGKAMSVATFMNRAVGTLMASTFLSTAKAMTYAGFFFLLAVIACIVLLFVHYFVPETNGHSLEDMSVYFAEITGDISFLEAEHRLVRERETRDNIVETAPRLFTPPTARDIPPEAIQDSTVIGTMS